MKKIISLLIIIALFAGCYGDPKEKIQNGNFEVQYLFEQDGCKVYRFFDGGRAVYFSNCKGKMQTDVTTNNKQTSTYNVETITTQQ